MTRYVINLILDKSMDELKAFFHSKGLEPRDIPKGIIAHEVLGIGILLSAWAGCYIVRPSSNLVKIAKRSPWIVSNSSSKSIWQSAEERAKKSRLLKFVNESKYLSNKKAQNVSMAFVESYVLRKILMPILIPLKFWLAFEIVVLLK